MKIKYNFGISNRCITPCPFSERNNEGIVSVGSFGCKLCKHHVRDNFPNEKSVECKHPVGKGTSRLAFALRAVLSGICIGIGGAAYLSLGGKMAVELKRHFIGSEISSEYAEKASKRIWNVQAQLTLF